MKTHFALPRLSIIALCFVLSACLDGSSDGETTAAAEAPADGGSGSGGSGTNSAPSISGSPPGSVTAGQAYSFRPSSSDADGDQLTFSVEGLPGWASLDPATGRLTGTPAQSDVGSYDNIVISVTDGVASDALTPFSITVMDAPSGNSSPTISGNPPSQVTVGNSYDFTPTANDPDGDGLTFSISNAPGWTSFDTATGRLSGTPGAGDVGSYSNIVITVSDGAASDSLAAFSIQVNAISNGSATLSWTPPTQNADGTTLTDLAGYTVHWGQSSGSYSNSADVTAGLTSYVVQNLGSGTWYFATRAYNSAGVYSNYSNEASKTIP